MKRQLCLVIFVMAGGVAAHAQDMQSMTPPPVKMGLWQMTNTGTVTGLELPPEVVAKLQAMGKPVPGAQPHTTVTQSCLTAEKWQKMFSDMQQNKDCHFVNEKMTSTGMSGDMACKSENGRTSSTGHFEASFVSEEKMTGKAHVETVNASMPKPMVMDMTFESVYQGSDCKGILPDSPRVVK